MTSDQILQSRVPLLHAAKMVGRRHGRIRQLVDAGKCRAWRRGRIIEVIPAEVVEAMVKDEVYTPALPVEDRKRDRRVGVSHPDISY